VQHPSSILALTALASFAGAQNICEGNGVGSAYIRTTNAILGGSYQIDLGSPAAPGGFAVLSVSPGFGPTVFPSPIIGNICLDVFDPGYFTISRILDASGNTTVAAAVPNDPNLLNLVPLYLNGLALEPTPGGPLVSISKTVRFSWERGESTAFTANTMAEGRDLHTATSLQRSPEDDRTAVFIAGGAGGNFMQPVATDTTEIYDPLTQAFTPGPLLSNPRTGHSATLLSDGRVLLAGGLDGTSIATATVDIFDPATGGITAAAPMLTARSTHRATLLDDGRVLVTGGFADWSAPLTNFVARLNTAIQSAEIYDPVTNLWTPLPDMASRRAGHSQVKLADGTVLVISGISGGAVTGQPPFGSGQVPVYTTTTEIFDPTTNQWSSAGVVTGTGFGAASRLADGSVLFTGGLVPNFASYNAAIPTTNTFLYDSATGQWSVGPALLTPVAFHTQTTMRDGSVLVTGGMIGNLTTLAGTSATQSLEGATSTWTAGTDLGLDPVLGGTASPRGTHTATLLHDGSLLVLGGSHQLVPSDDALVYYR